MAGVLSSVDVELGRIRKIHGYIQTGMDTAICVGIDIADNNPEDDRMIKNVHDVALEYAEMERTYNQFVTAMDATLKESNEQQDTDGNSLEATLDAKLTELKKSNTDAELKEHPKYIELNEKIWTSLHPDEPEPSSVPVEQLDDDIAITTQDVNTRCPITMQEMVHPMKNVHCGHHYDKQGVETLIKNRKGKAKCPVGGCKNEKSLKMSDIKESPEMKRYIEQKSGVRHAKQKFDTSI